MSSRRRRRAAKKAEDSGTSTGTAPETAGEGDWSTATFVADASSAETRGDEVALPDMSMIEKQVDTSNTSDTSDTTNSVVAESKKSKQRRRKKKKRAEKSKRERGSNSVGESDYFSDGTLGGDDGCYFELPTTALALTYKGAPKYVMLKDQPVKLTEVRMKKKSTNKGNDRIECKGLHIVTGKLYQDTIVGTVNVPVLKVKFARYTLLDLDQSDGSVTLMDDDGEIKEDANLAKSGDGPELFDAVGQEVARRFEEEEELDVVVFTCMGREVVVEVHAAAA